MNILKDKVYEIEYMFIATETLIDPDMRTLIGEIQKEEKEYLFNSWKSAKPNLEWKGDIKKKREELFTTHHRYKSPVLVPLEVCQRFLGSRSKGNFEPKD